MNGKKYWKERAGWIVAALLQMALIIGLGLALQINKSYILLVVFWELFVLIRYEISQFHKRHVFYQDLYRKLEELDKKYLLTEMIEEPGFFEGDLLCDVLYESHKSMNEHVGVSERSMWDFKEYVELWIHEIKLPISALSLMSYNENMDFKAYQRQVEKVSQHVERILYYVRADAPEKDFAMKKCSLDQMINTVLKEHKEVLIAEHFTIEKTGTDVSVVSDAKWVQFMLGQMIHNSVKYKRGEAGYLGFSVEEEERSVVLTVEDHGIGVAAGDVKRVFDKSFTGENGRKVAASTGMGLFICRKMCHKLGHEIWMESQEGAWTRVKVRFGKDDYYFNDEGQCGKGGAHGNLVL